MRLRFSPTASLLSVRFESDDGSSSIDDVSIGIGSAEAGGVRVLVGNGSSLISTDDVSIGSGWEVRVSTAAEGSSSLSEVAVDGREALLEVKEIQIKLYQIHTLNPTGLDAGLDAGLDDFISVQ